MSPEFVLRASRVKRGTLSVVTGHGSPFWDAIFQVSKEATQA